MDGAQAAVLLAVALIGLAFLALWIYLLVWVHRDATARGLNAGMWVVIVFFFGVVGLIIYLVQRPPGRLIPCPSCGQLRHETAWVCPHCYARRDQSYYGS